MKQIGLSRTESIILFENYDVGHTGSINFDEFLGANPVITEDRENPRRVCEQLKEKIETIVLGYKKFIDRSVEALHERSGRWLPATLLNVNSDGTFEVEWEKRDRNGRLLICRDCPRSWVKLSVADLVKVTVEVGQGENFPSNGMFRNRRASHIVCVFGDRGRKNWQEPEHRLDQNQISTKL